MLFYHVQYLFSHAIKYEPFEKRIIFYLDTRALMIKSLLLNFEYGSQN